ncbi:hypothetical protein Tco_0488324 [Tanacetum coccineum]
MNKSKSEDISNTSTYPPGYTPKDGIEIFCNNGENSKKECGEFSQGGYEEGVNDVFKDIGSNKGSKDDVAESSPLYYGPTPFSIFYSWFEMEGFNKLVEDAWNEAPVDESNAMSNMMKKLKYLKQKIRDWNKGNMKSSKNIKAKLKDDLKAVDDIIDNGEGNDEVVKLRMDVLKSLVVIGR